MPEVFVESVIDVCRLLTSSNLICLFGLRFHVCQYEFTTFEHAMLSKLVCHSRELLQQFIMDDPRGNRKGTYHVIMHPYTLHSLAKGHTLKYFEPHLKLSSLKACYALLCFVFSRCFFLGFSLLASGQ